MTSPLHSLVRAVPVCFVLASSSIAAAAAPAPQTAPDGPAPSATAHPHPALPDVFHAPPDASTEDLSLAPGTVVVELLDPDDQPLPGSPVTLRALRQSPAHGETTQSYQAVTDPTGRATFVQLQGSSEITYLAARELPGSVFSAPPFHLSVAHGERVTLHEYPVTRDFDSATVINQTIVFLEMHDDHLEVEEQISFFNFGRIAWSPERFLLQLPAGTTGFGASPSSPGHEAELSGDSSVLLRGTFPPGRQDVSFRWQLPYHGERALSFDIGMPPHLASVRAVAAVTRRAILEVARLPEPVARIGHSGQRLLLTEAQLQPDHPLKSLHVSLRGLSGQGSGRLLVTCLAALVAAFGLVLGVRRTSRAGDPQSHLRARLLEEVAALERGLSSGELGPATYQRARRDLARAIARSFGPTS